MKFFKKIHGFPLFFYSELHIFAIFGGGGLRPPNPLQMHMTIFLKLLAQFPRKFR